MKQLRYLNPTVLVSCEPTATESVRKTVNISKSGSQVKVRLRLWNQSPGLNPTRTKTKGEAAATLVKLQRRRRPWTIKTGPSHTMSIVWNPAGNKPPNDSVLEHEWGTVPRNACHSSAIVPRKLVPCKDNTSIKDNTIDKINTISTIKEAKNSPTGVCRAGPLHKPEVDGSARNTEEEDQSFLPPPHSPQKWKEVRVIRSVHLQSRTDPRNKDSQTRPEGLRDKKKQWQNWSAR